MIDPYIGYDNPHINVPHAWIFDPVRAAVSCHANEQQGFPTLHVQIQEVPWAGSKRNSKRPLWKLLTCLWQFILFCHVFLSPESPEPLSKRRIFASLFSCWMHWKNKGTSHVLHKKKSQKSNCKWLHPLQLHIADDDVLVQDFRHWFVGLHPLLPMHPFLAIGELCSFSGFSM